MKIAIIEPVGGHGGMHYYDFGLAEGLVAAGADIIVYTCDKTAVPPELPFEVQLIFRKIWGDEHKLLRAVRFTICLFKTLLDARRKKVDVVHYHFFHYTQMERLCVMLAQLFRMKIVITAHDVESFAGKYSDSAASWILAKADKVIAHNVVSKNELTGHVNLPPEKIAIIPHGNYLHSIVNSSPPAEARKILGIVSKGPILLFFGQIKKVKGLDLLLQALPAVISKLPTLKLVIAGRVWKDDFSTYDRLIQENNLQDHVDLHIRYIPDEEVATFYRSADLIVLPYRRIYQSGVLLMAMSYGVPVMASDLEGMVDVVRHDVNGFLFKNGNISSLSEQLIYALSDDGRLKQISAAGLEKMQQFYSWHSVGRQTVKLYESIQ